MLYTWSSIYHTQAVKGLQFDALKPVMSIWLLTGSIFKDDDKCHHKFGIWDKDNNVQLTDHCDIHVIELAKWKMLGKLQLTEYWLYFFKEAKNWKTLLDPLKSLAIMRQAMKTLEEISTNENEYLAYLSRQEQIMLERTLQSQLKEAQEIIKIAAEQQKAAAELQKETTEQREQLYEMQQSLAKADADKAVIEADKAAIEADKAQLLKLLKQAGIEPNIT